MNSAAESTLKRGLNPFGSSSKAIADNTANVYGLQDSDDNITNVIKQAINVEFNVDNAQECIDSQKVNQELDISNCKVGGSIDFTNYTQEASVENLGSCMLKQGVANKIINSAKNALGVEAVNDAKFKAKIEQTAQSSSTLIADLLSPASAAACIVCACLCTLIIILVGGGEEFLVGSEASGAGSSYMSGASSVDDFMNPGSGSNNNQDKTGKYIAIGIVVFCIIALITVMILLFTGVIPNSFSGTTETKHTHKHKEINSEEKKSSTETINK